MKKLLLLSSTVLLAASCSQEKRLLHKAEVATERMEYEQAIAYYDEVLQKNSNSYRANAGKGIVLSEFTEQYDKAIPYLSKALSESPRDTLMNLNYNLGKSYHITGNYTQALYYYGKLKGYTEKEDPGFSYTLNKAVDDCHYALAHPEVAPPTEQMVSNIGNPVNTPMPEYGAVMVGNDMIFTSKRKDEPNEKKNPWTGKYFESMYISTLENGKFSEPRRYTLPDLGNESEYQKHNEAVISASADGKKLYVYRDAEIYEANISAPGQEPDNMGKSINFARFQNHAYVTGNESKMFFTSESKRGIGGTDIYVSEKVDGKWSKPQLLDTGVVNTDFNEDAPYYSEDGTLFFSSNGLPGYGGYDIYKTRFENGHWTTPENLGQPINSPADDIFFVLNGNSPDGYYSSSRIGGEGNMDIYNVHYVSPKMPDTLNLPLAIVPDSAALYAKQDSIDQYNINSGQVGSIGWTPAPVYFDYDDAQLRPDAMASLDQNIRILKSNTKLNFTITGHADSRGGEAYNQQLSLKRAYAVKNYLVKNGISQRRIKGTSGSGETALVNGCSDGVACTEEEHQQNRRVEFKVLFIEKPFAAAAK